MATNESNAPKKAVEIISADNINDFVLSELTIDVPYCAFGTLKDEEGKIVQTMKQCETEHKEKGEDPYSKAQAERTKTYRLVFKNVPLKQVIDLHAKTTTLFKKVYNDMIYNVTDKDLKARDKVIEIDVADLLKKVDRANKKKANECEKSIAGMRSIGISEDKIEQFRTVFMQG